MKRALRLGAVTMGTMLVAACDLISPAEEDAGAVEDLTIVVEADKSRILEEEKALQEKQSKFESEKERLDAERQAIAEKLSSLSKKDKKQKERLLAEEKRIEKEQQELRARSENFEAERRKLSEEKTKLLDRISQMTQTKGGLTIGQREEIIARREREVARREKEVAQREAALALREERATRTLEALQGAIDDFKQAGVAVEVAPARSAAPAGTRSGAQSAQRRAQQKMQLKGILPGDLSPRDRELESQAQSSLKEKDYTAAERQFGQLASNVESIQIDRTFVKGKMARITRELGQKEKKLSKKDRDRVGKLLSQMNESWLQSRYDRTNSKINQIYKLLAKL